MDKRLLLIAFWVAIWTMVIIPMVAFTYALKISGIELLGIGALACLIVYLGVWLVRPRPCKHPHMTIWGYSDEDGDVWIISDCPDCCYHSSQKTSLWDDDAGS
ncbi:MAG: hypothetical protein ACYSWO_29615 [Planctomycetota bacterium]|jgi:hypothetical protein